MNLSLETTLFAIKILTGVALLFQTLEFLILRNTFSEAGVWRWSSLQNEFKIFGKLFFIFLNCIFKYDFFLNLLRIRLLLILIFLLMNLFQSPFLISIQPYLLSYLFLSTLLISLRWRGSFNGGSDFMMLILLLGLTLISFFPDYLKIQKGVLLYISIQTTASYFIAGLVKIKKTTWRTGKALLGFMKTSPFGSIPCLEYLLQNHFCALIITWLILLFELFFPLILFSKTLILIFIPIAFLFHLANFYIFGLNRFLWVWCSAYPALIYISQTKL